MTETRKEMAVDLVAGQFIKLSLSSVDFGEIVITLDSKSGKRARLRIEAADSVKIKRPPDRVKTP